MTDVASSSDATALHAKPTTASVHGSEENCSAVHNSSSSSTVAATGGGNKHDASNDSERKTKKHSGPRKRRPRKKPAGANAPAATSATATITTSSNTLRPPTTDSTADDIEALLQHELTHTATALDDDSPSCRPVYHRCSHNHAAPPRQPEQAGELALADMDFALEHDRTYWTQWVIAAAEKERARRLNILKQLQREEDEEIQRRRSWAIAAIEREQAAMMRELFVANMQNTQWFQSTIARAVTDDYEVVCPNSWFGCVVSCMLKDLERHLEHCVYRQVPDALTASDDGVDLDDYDVVCPNAVLGCSAICARADVAAHLATCPVNGISREKEWEERLEGRRHVLLATEQERARRVREQQHCDRDDELTTDSDWDNNTHRFSYNHLQQLYEEQTAVLQVVLHDEIVDFCDQEARVAAHLRPMIVAAVAYITHQIEACWSNSDSGKSEANATTPHVASYGSFATQLHGGSFSDVDLVVFNVADASRGRTCEQSVCELAAHLMTSDETTADRLRVVDVSAITKASVPLLKAVVLVPNEMTTDTVSDSVVRIPVDITFDDPSGASSHNGIASAALVTTLASRFVGLRELARVLKRFLVKRGGNDPYVGGLSSYGLLLMIIFVLQEQGAVVAAPNETDVSEVDCVDNAGELYPRWEAQRRKGERVAHEIIRQSLARQQRRVESGGHSRSGATKRRARRLHLPSLLGAADDEDSETRPHVLGKYLMDVLQFYGNDFRQHVDAIDVLGPRDPVAAASDSSDSAILPATGSPPLPPSAAMSSPPTLPVSAATRTLSSPSLPSLSITTGSPLSHEGLLLIRDPLQPENNVGKSCYRVSQVCRDFSDFLSFLTALIVRGSVMTTGKKPHRQPATTTATTPHSADHVVVASSPSETPVRATSHRILTSVFEMKTRDTRTSIDLSS